ncbi:SEC-C metal-binding domain-containing protein [Saprospiraceae bacterium]|nr:SEC-C metal-binding domain-containing protein [Saprospiraceae bacterium]
MPLPIFSNINYCSKKSPYDLHDKIRANFLIDDQKILESISKEYPDNFYVDLFCSDSLYFSNDDLDGFIKRLELQFERYPESIGIRYNICLQAFTDFNNSKQSQEFEKLFEPEIEAIFENKPYPHVLLDEEMFLLLNVLLDYYVETEQKEKYHTIFKIFLGIGNLEQIKEACYTIKDKDNPFFDDDLLMDENTDEWLQKVMSLMIKKKHSEVPHFEFSYLLLNKDFEYFDDKDIGLILSQKDVTKVEEDLNWVLYQSFDRYSEWDGQYIPHSLISVVYVAAHYKIFNIVPTIFQILKDVTKEFSDGLFGDMSYEMLHPPLYLLLQENTDYVYEMMTSQPESETWFLKSDIARILSMILYDHPEHTLIRELIDRLFDNYVEHDYEMLGWLIYAIGSQKIQGYDDRIKQAYNEDKIDGSKYGTYDDLITSDYSYDLKHSYRGGNTLQEHHKNFQEILAFAIEPMAKVSTKKYIKKQIKDDEARFELEGDIEDVSYFGLFDDINENQYYDTPIIPIRRDLPKVGRNDTCPCGSGKKYKKCCLSN